MHNYSRPDVIQYAGDQPRVEIRPLMRMVYMWMGLGMLVTAFVSMFVAASEPLQTLILGNSIVMLLLIFGQLGLVIGLSAAINRMSAGVASALFFVYAAMMGLTMSTIFLVYPIGSIVAAFFTTTALFGVMTVVGFTTSVDLSQYRTYLMMGLIGLVVAMVVNMFLGSGPLDFLISLVGVVLFTALTAYDTQKIKEMAANPDLDASADNTLKLSILGALTLYLDFINLFLFLLRLFGGGGRD